jgi:hypothetical protein
MPSDLSYILAHVMDSSPALSWLQQPSFFPRVSTRDGRVIEEALAGETLFDSGVTLDGAMIEAAYAYDRPPLLKRLADDHVRKLIDPQTLRFAGENFLDTERLTRLPYAPPRVVRPSSFSAADANELAFGVLAYQQDRGVDAYLAPALPLADDDLHLWQQHNYELLSAACGLNGVGEVGAKPLIAQVAPGAQTQRDPEFVLRLLMDLPVQAIYVQPLRLNPVKDSLEKLARFVQFLEVLQASGLPIMVGRVGAFGLVLEGLGVSCFDSGLGTAETHDLAQLNRPLSEKERQAREEGKSGGAKRRIYLGQLMTTMPSSSANLLLRNSVLRHHFTCKLACCRFRALEELESRARTHYLYARAAEVQDINRFQLQSMRIADIERKLQQAIELGDRATKAAPVGALPDFGHLRRWLGLLAREQEAAQAA